ncbi:MAG TPA: Nif11-like leader peptide family natural product precursor [Thermoanaerobaculia bacterium]|jgi:predicted ribosomally synthesized peptide with nif11-like leader
MSLQAASKFLEKAKSSKAIHNEFEKSTTKTLIEIGREHGFEFTREELRQAMADHHIANWAGCWGN